jgi:hypothetical protein
LIGVGVGVGVDFVVYSSLLGLILSGFSGIIKQVKEETNKEKVGA